LEEDGLVTITGGKLTIFELMAEDALKTAARLIGKNLSPIKDWFKPIPADLPGNPLAPQSFYYLAGRYGQALPDLLEVSTPHDLTRIDDLYMHWAELLYNAHFGMVEHLDDLLLRHTRLGLLLPNGAMDVMDKIQDLTAPHLPWSDDEWRIEISRYQQIYLQAFSPNPGSHLE
jgi:glycerol-3-phosphate dehydrogenase